MNTLLILAMWMAMGQTGKTTPPTPDIVSTFYCAAGARPVVHSNSEMSGVTIDDKESSCVFDISVVIKDVTVNGEHYAACGPTDKDRGTPCYRKYPPTKWPKPPKCKPPLVLMQGACVPPDAVIVEK